MICQLYDEVIQECCRSLSPRLFQCKTLDKECWAALKSLQRPAQKNPDVKAKVERCKLSDMDKFKCICLSLRTDDNNKRSLVQRKETVEYTATMVKFSLVKRISGVLMLDKESFLAFQKQWYGSSLEEAKAKWKSALVSPHRQKLDGVVQVALKKPTGILDEYTIGAEEKTNAMTSNVDKMTAKHLFSDHSESQTFGAESSALGAAALA